MSARHRHRGSRRPALFDWTTSGDTTTHPQAVDNPMTRACGHCHAPIGHPCTRPAGQGQRAPIHGYHHTRTQTVEEAG